MLGRGDGPVEDPHPLDGAGWMGWVDLNWSVSEADRISTGQLQL